MFPFLIALAVAFLAIAARATLDQAARSDELRTHLGSRWTPERQDDIDRAETALRAATGSQMIAILAFVACLVEIAKALGH